MNTVSVIFYFLPVTFLQKRYFETFEIRLFCFFEILFSAI